QETARARHLQGLVSEQSLYNLLERRIEMEVLPAAREYGLGVIPWSPLMRGVLGGILRKEREGRSASETTQAVLTKHRDKVEAYEAFCDQLGSHPADVGVAWLLAQPGVTAPIIGPRTGAQLDSNVAALEVRLDEASLQRLDEIFPPVGPAPQAYAW
ncbi:MAG: aldo/keto reductase, partial [Candidatus Dormibacteraeota bacterium]|nr:aldo/keto reductase [Candidatus Dormibacteraeota bacterium]